MPECLNLQVAQLWQRPRELDQRFQGGGQFEAKLQIEGLLFAPVRYDAIYAYAGASIVRGVGRAISHIFKSGG